MTRVSSQTIGEKLVDLTAQGVTLGLLHCVELAERRKVLVRNRNDFDSTHRPSSLHDGFPEPLQSALHHMLAEVFAGFFCRLRKPLGVALTSAQIHHSG